MFIIKEYSMAIKLDEKNKILQAYEIKNNVVEQNSKEILTEANNLIYEKIKSHFKINTQDFGLHINHYTNEKMNIQNLLRLQILLKKDL